MHCPQCGTHIKNEEGICPSCKKVIKRQVQKYCKKCGAKASQYASACENCGSHDLGIKEELVTVEQSGGVSRRKTRSKGDEISSSSLSILKLVAVIVMVMIFIPCMTVKCSGETVAELSDFNVLIGTTYEGDKIFDENTEENMTPRIFAILVVGCTVLAIFADISCNSYKQRGIVSIISGLGISAFQMLLKDKVVEMCEEIGARVIIQYPHYIILIGGIVICILGVLLTVVGSLEEK